MIITFYDKDFVALSDNSSLNVSDWSLKRSAVDYDDFTCTSEAFTEEIQPTFAVLKDDNGRYKYACFAGIPTLNPKNQTALQGSDFKTYFNNEIYAKLTHYVTVQDLFNGVLTIFMTQVNQSSFNIKFDMSDILSIALTPLYFNDTEYNKYNVWDILVKYMKYYNIYCYSELDLINKKIIYYFKKTTTNILGIHLWEYGIKTVGKFLTSTNQTQGIINYNGVLTYCTTWILRSDNTITTEPTKADIFPIKKKYYIKSVTDESDDYESEIDQEALSGIVEARFNESFEISIDDSQYLNSVDFNYSFNCYIKKNGTITFYKQLPLGSITEGSSNGIEQQKILTLGYKVDDIVFYINN